ncbi:MAG: SWIM zinc finger family protein [Phormidesmis sp.]
MSQFSRTWWGQKFIEAIEDLTDAGRLSRGRSYARGRKVKSFEINNEVVSARVRGSVNPYFGVHKEPLYKTTITFKPFTQTQWSEAIALVSSKAGLISRLLLNEIPDNIEETFQQLDLNLLPSSQKDFKSKCSCPDYSNPCKHIAGVYYLVAAELDQDPFLLFSLRGLSRSALLAELAKSPLGKALSAELQIESQRPRLAESYYATLQITDPVSLEGDLRAFWQGSKQLPQSIEMIVPPPVSGIMVKKQGDFPAFWHRDNSFITAMETLYEQVKTKGRL